MIGATPSSFSFKRLAWVGLASCLLAACAGPQSYVALVPSPDGSIGQVEVQVAPVQLAAVAGLLVCQRCREGMP